MKFLITNVGCGGKELLNRYNLTALNPKVISTGIPYWETVISVEIPDINTLVSAISNLGLPFIIYPKKNSYFGDVPCEYEWSIVIYDDYIE